jgi:signal transduction histidine kinase/ActR/RegA family two-component response regulator
MGVPVGSLKGRTIHEFVNDATFEEIQNQTKLREKGKKSTYEIVITRSDGEKRVLLLTATPTFNENGEFESSLGILIDITDRKEIENTLKKNESELKALNTTKDKLFSIIAHDLRGPVGTSADLLGVMIESYEELSSDEQLKMLEILKNSAVSTYNLLETLLNWSVVQTGNLVYKPELFDVTNCIDTTVKNMVPTAFAKNISLIFEHKKKVPIYTDQNMIQTVFRNLIGNAIKYTHRGGRIEVKIDDLEDATIFSVKDNGVGIEEETIKNLFILNQQNSKYGTDNEKGTGLGLILCKEFIEKTGGHIRVESEMGQGSCFIFDIPKKIAQADLQNQDKNLKEQEHNRFNGELILIVEDDEINYQVLRSILTGANLNYERAENGKKAVDLFLKNNYRLILMDIQLPEMNGWETTMKIRENDSDIPIIALTAYSSVPTRKKSKEAGCNEFVMKPINKVKLLQLIDKYLQKTRIDPFSE